MLQIILR